MFPNVFIYEHVFGRLCMDKAFVVPTPILRHVDYAHSFTSISIQNGYSVFMSILSSIFIHCAAFVGIFGSIPIYLQLNCEQQQQQNGRVKKKKTTKLLMQNRNGTAIFSIEQQYFK